MEECYLPFPEPGTPVNEILILATMFSEFMVSWKSEISVSLTWQPCE